MRLLRTILLCSAFLAVGCREGSADTLLFSAAGQFAPSVTSTSLAGPGASWRLSFIVNSTPVAGNVTSLGFDAPFSSFNYSLNNSSIAATPASIRFFTTGNLGMFTVFFGPQSGFQNGVPIPEFSFSGAQLFSGSTANPTLLTGTYPVSEFVYSDSVNYDDHLPANFSLSVTSVPEPSAFAAAFLGLVLVGFSQSYRLRKSR